MAVFDVLVFDARTGQNKVFRNQIKKHLAKDLVKDLREKGFKAQLVTSKGQTAESVIEIPEDEEVEE